MPDPRPRPSTGACLLVLLASSALAAPDPPIVPIVPEAASASGTFEDARFKLEIAGAYAFWDKTIGTGDALGIRVAVSNSAFLPEALDEHYDRGHAISTLFVDEDTKVVYFEFDESGKYHGLSYYFESGDGCGYCYDSQVKSTVRAAGGRLKGEISYAGDDRRFQIALDLPIPPRSWGEPLPKDGGEPGKAFLAYHAALEKRDKKAILALSDADMKKRFLDYEKQGKLDGYLDYRWHDEHSDLKTIAITGGYLRGDHAVVLFDASNAYIDHLYGEAILRREGGAWLFHRDMVQVGSR
jgi:hypothetical protein